MVNRRALPVAKPMELVAAREEFQDLFNALQEWFAVPRTIRVDVSGIDAEAAVVQLRDPVMIAAMAMRKLQALYFAAEPAVFTSIHVVLSLIDGVLQALLEAPDSYMQREASKCDWDSELWQLDQGLLWKDPRRTDQQIEQFERSLMKLIELRSLLGDMAERGCSLIR